MDKHTHFGFEVIPESEKPKKVAHVFDSVARKYDIMNDLMSIGLHRAWKWFTVEVSGLRMGDKVLDIAGGTGDLSLLFFKKVGPSGQVWLTDINRPMLGIGRDRLLDKGVLLPVVQCDAEKLPFPDGYFDCVSVAFGLRNVTHKRVALKEMCRVIKPGGRLLVLEFSKIWPVFQSIYDIYSFRFLPMIGKWVAQDADAYRYLAESIRMHPDQEALKEMISQAGFSLVDYHNLSAGIVALHKGVRL